MKKLELGYEIIKESKKSRALYLESGRDYHKVAAHMYSIFECYAHGLIKWNTARTYWNSSILEYLNLYKDNKKLYVMESNRMLAEYEDTLNRFKPALDEYKKVSEAKMVSNIVVKKQISESVAKDHSNIYFNKRSLSESAIKDIAHTTEWKKVVESYPNLTSNDKDRLRMLTIFENDTFNVTGWSKLNEGYKTIKSIDKERYDEIPGLEGPFMTLSGKVVYYDPKEGSYYDRDTDMYLSYEEFKKLDNDYSGMKNTREIKEAEEGTYMKQWYDYSEDFAMLELYVDGKLVDQWNDYFGANVTGNPLQQKFIDMAKKNGVDPIGLKVIDGENGNEGVFTSRGLKWNSTEAKAKPGHNARAMARAQDIIRKSIEQSQKNVGKKDDKKEIKESRIKAVMGQFGEAENNIAVSWMEKHDPYIEYHINAANNALKAGNKEEQEKHKDIARLHRKAQIQWEMNWNDGRAETMSRKAIQASKETGANIGEAENNTVTLQHQTSGKEIVVMKSAKQKIKDLIDNGYDIIKENQFGEAENNIAVAFGKAGVAGGSYRSFEVYEQAAQVNEGLRSGVDFDLASKEYKGYVLGGEDDSDEDRRATLWGVYKALGNGTYQQVSSVKDPKSNGKYSVSAYSSGVPYEAFKWTVDNYLSADQTVSESITGMKKAVIAMIKNGATKADVKKRYPQLHDGDVDGFFKTYKVDEAYINTNKDAISILGNLRKISKSVELGQRKYEGNLAGEYANDVWEVYNYIESKTNGFQNINNNAKAAVDAMMQLRKVAKGMEREPGSGGNAQFANQVVNTLYPVMQYLNSIKEESAMNEAVTLDYSRHVRSHGKKPRDPGYSALWMFTTREYDMPDDDEIFKFQGSFADAKKAAAKWAKTQGAYRVYVME